MVFLIAACSSAFLQVIEWVEDQDKLITNGALEQQFGSLSDEPIDDVLEQRTRTCCTLAFDRKRKLRHRS